MTLVEQMCVLAMDAGIELDLVERDRMAFKVGDLPVLVNEGTRSSGWRTPTPMWSVVACVGDIKVSVHACMLTEPEKKARVTAAHMMAMIWAAVEVQ